MRLGSQAQLASFGTLQWGTEKNFKVQVACNVSGLGR
jgi:hypothetical protein